jgi:hypothetical protein
MKWKNVKFWVWIEVFMPIDASEQTTGDGNGNGSGSGSGSGSQGGSGSGTGPGDQQNADFTNGIYNDNLQFGNIVASTDTSNNHQSPFQTIDAQEGSGSQSGGSGSGSGSSWIGSGSGSRGPVNPNDPPHTDCGTDPVGYAACFDVLRFSSEFEVNGIPSAQVSVAIGRRADRTDKAAEIHYYVNDMKLQLKAWVWCLADTSAGTDIDPNFQFWPEGKFRIFDGYVTGTGFRRNDNGAELTLGLTHWLTDLNFSSTLSRQSHAMNPAHLYFPANVALTSTFTGGEFISGTNITTMTGESLALPYFEGNIVREDFWGGFPLSDVNRKLSGLKDWFTNLTHWDRLNSAEILNLTSTPISSFRPSYNWEACRALSRFEPNASYNETEEEGYILGIPVSFSNAGALNSFISESLGRTVGRDTFDSSTGVTIWDKLSGNMQSEFKLSIIPLVEKALVVPQIACLSTKDDSLVHRILRTPHYESIEMSGTMPKALRAVGLFANRASQSGDGFGQPRGRPVSIGGWYDRSTSSDDPRFNEGLIMFKSLPAWANFIHDRFYSPTSTGAGGGTVQTVASVTAGAAAPVSEPAALISAAKSIWDLLAKTYYIQEVFKGRQGTISGPVRFDIAPGSTLKVEIAEDTFVRDIVNDLEFTGAEDPNVVCNDDYYTFFYCNVMRVSTIIDAQNMRAATVYYVGNIHSEVENQDPGTSVEAHPIWSQCQWGGCVLIQDPSFAPNYTSACDA